MDINEEKKIMVGIIITNASELDGGDIFPIKNFSPACPVVGSTTEILWCHRPKNKCALLLKKDKVVPTAEEHH